ncbi:phosphoadenylyl-sulfate reductase [Segetibacter aerophilus]|uniref:Adenosine 5'-phosphosulfate reductase n=1 Tax=Segetibacter aerophilus TaxID=670293 RepID=A0A512BER5_9BACT|nr:phosphoadenylyl-sulfate reductase [Segetibacter aerophilus]GEO10442.1 phosphoadenosine phosphosulfate reductase [Segetibacter aerophilus]
MSNEFLNMVEDLQSQAKELSIPEMLKYLTEEFPGQVTFSTSFSFEDQAIAHNILNNQLPIKIFTLDTGRLFPETYSVWSATNERYHTNINAYYPNAEMLQELVSERGPNSFYESPQNRIDCCHIRKVEPLRRALAGHAIWITGLRAEHSANRHEMPMVEFDAKNNIIKYHPLLHWSTEDVRNYINEFNVPYNILHDRGFVSIGCAPCTRAIRPGEDFRAGRWWWEDSSKKECGLHVSAPETANATN